MLNPLILLSWGINFIWQGNFSFNRWDIKTKSIRKSSNFNFQWTNTLYQNIVSHIALFFTLFKGYKYDKLCEITPKEIGALENKFQISQELRKHRHAYWFHLICEIWGFWCLFSRALIRTFSSELFHTTYYIYSPWKVWKEKQYAWNYSGTRFLSTEN